MMAFPSFPTETARRSSRKTWLLVCRIRWIEKEEPCVNVGDTLGKDVLHTLAITPPISRIVIRIRNRNDADGDIMAKSFLKKEASAPRVNILSHNVDTSHRHIVFAKPVPERDAEPYVLSRSITRDGTICSDSLERPFFLKRSAPTLAAVL